MTDPTIDPAHSKGLVTQFQSIHNADWYVGFNKQGKRLPGDYWKKAATDKLMRMRRKLYSFDKLILNHPSPHEESAGNGGVHGPVPHGAITKQWQERRRDLLLVGNERT